MNIFSHSYLYSSLQNHNCEVTRALPSFESGGDRVLFNISSIMRRYCAWSNKAFLFLLNSTIC